MSNARAVTLSRPARQALGLAGLGALLAWFGCDLGQAEVVKRSPDLGPAISVAARQDASGPALDDAAADASEPSRSDGSSPAKDMREASTAGPDASRAQDALDAPGVSRRDATSLDGSCAAEAGGACGLVLSDDFEDGAAGWMSTGIAWEVTDEPDATPPNAVLAPTGPAASSVYFAAGAWQDMTVAARVRVTAFGQASSANRVEIYARYQAAGSFYALSVRADGKLGLRVNSSGLGQMVDVAVGEDEWHTLKLRVSGPRDSVSVEGYLDGLMVTAATDTSGSLPNAVGTVGVGIYGETMAVFDDVEVSSP